MKFAKNLVILLSPVLVGLALFFPENSTGRQMLDQHLAQEALRRGAALAPAPKAAIEASLQEAILGAARPLARPDSIRLAAIRPVSRPDPLGPLAAQLGRIIAATPAAEIPAPPRRKIDLSAEDCIAIANYHEARGEGIRGQIAVSSVILKRAAVPRRWGDSACEVVRPTMFSFMISETDFPPIEDLNAWKIAKVIAREALRLGPLPQLRHADHYHTHEVSPFWRKAMPRVVVVGNHAFYADPLSKSRG